MINECQSKIIPPLIVMTLIMIVVGGLGLILETSDAQTFIKRANLPYTILSNEVIDLPQGSTPAWYNITVPSDAVDAKLSGRYEVHGGLIQQANVALADSKQCPEPWTYTKDNHNSCNPTYLNEVKSLGVLDLPLPSGKVYYLIFYNEGFLGERKQIQATVELNYQTLVPVTNGTQ